jgi:hypothetical protein
MFFSTMLTFFVVPCVHLVLGRLGERIRGATAGMPERVTSPAG